MAEDNKIKALFIFEIMGRPPGHIKKTMGELVDKLGEFKGVEIFRKEIHEPKPVEKEDVKDLFTTFAEVELFGKDLNVILDIVFNAMPSHVEILEPAELRFKNFDLSSMLSTLTVKLHRYDEIAKALTFERNVLVKRLKEMEEGGSEEKKN